MSTSRKQWLPSKESIKKLFLDYCENTTIHGFKYIGEQGRPKFERIWWILMFLLSMVGSMYLISKVWRKFYDSPVIVSFSETATPVWQIPFPAVTICSETKVERRVSNSSNIMYNTNFTEEKIMDDISLVCGQYLNTNGSRFTDESTIQVITQVAPQLHEMVWLCRWEMVEMNCSKLFTPVLTEEGICFSFNILHALEMYRDAVVQRELKVEEEEKRIKLQWSLDTGYDISAPVETYPYRALGAGANARIFVILRAYNYNLGYLCQGPDEGFKVLLHNPVEIPRLSERYFRVTPNNELSLAVTPNMMTTSEGLRSYWPSERSCYFSSERYLAYFKVYTQRNCELECLTNYTLKRCQCAAIHMPRLESTPMCGAGSKQCTIDASNELNTEEIMLSMQKIQTWENTCNCLPACTSLQYNAETSQGNFDWIKQRKKYRIRKNELDRVQLSRLSVHFKDIQFFSKRRHEVYGVADFLANCGGLLGLFSGISVLSFVEIIYYATLRFYTNVKLENKRKANTVSHHSDEFNGDLDLAVIHTHTGRHNNKNNYTEEEYVVTVCGTVDEI